jgi:TrmH family RNA methyltransferase
VLSKNKIKFLRSLSSKKNRYKEGVYIAEGEKLVTDLINASQKIKEVFCTEEMALKLENLGLNNNDIYTVEVAEIKKVSNLKTATEVIAVVEISNTGVKSEELKGELSIALDGIQDPGNLGTIIRIADWFGIKNIICSDTTVDIYNPKTVQATMGAIARVSASYTHLPDFLSSALMQDIPVYGTFMSGKNLFTEEFETSGIIVLGNEGKGLSSEVADIVTDKIHIPSYPLHNNTSESLNVAMAASIVCAEFRRRIICKA